MATITTRSGKGSPLTNNEVDSNFTNLNTDKVEKSGDSITGNLSFADNAKAVFGAGSDLQIYHDGSNSWIDDAGTGNLVIRANSDLYLGKYTGETFLHGVADGRVDIYYNNAIKLTTTNTGVDVTGTLVSDGLTVDDSGEVATFGNTLANNFISVTRTDLNPSTIQLGATSNQGVIRYIANNGFKINDITSGEKRRFQISGGGDISFYEDTGTTAKFFWDASAESLEIDGQIGITNFDALNLGTAHGGGASIAYANDGNLKVNPRSGYSTVFESGNVGIGTDSPQGKVNIVRASSGATRADEAQELVLEHPYNVGMSLLGADGRIAFGDSADNDAGLIRYTHSDDSMMFITAGGERLRISSSGNLLVGKTNTTANTAGIELNPAGFLRITRGGAEPLHVNRTANNGKLISLRKDNTEVGSIGNNSGGMYVGSGDTGVTFEASLNSIIPTNTSNGSYTNGQVDIGYSTTKFKDLHLSGIANTGGLDVDGTIKLNADYPVGVGNLAMGVGAGDGITTGNNNISFGRNAGTSISSGSNNIAIGSYSQDLVTTGTYNIGVGYGTLSALTTGTRNVAIGESALSVTTGDRNTAIGSEAGLSLTTGGQNVYIGDVAGRLATTSSFNVMVGRGTGAQITTAASSVGLGHQALGYTTTGGDNVAVGRRGLYENTTGNNNVAVGHEALYSSTTSSQNTAVGSRSLRGNTTGTRNTALGYGAADAVTTASNITAVGWQAAGQANVTATAVGAYALNSLTSGSSSTAVGYYSMQATTTGNNNTAFGSATLQANTTGYQNVAIGSSALYSATTAIDNTAVGYNTMRLTTGSGNTAVGSQALDTNTTGQRNTAVGALSLTDNTTGSYNVAIGQTSLPNNTTGNSNVSIGYQSMNNATTASQVVSIGQNSGRFTTTGGGNVYIGYEAGHNGTTAAGNVAIGRDALRDNGLGERMVAVGYGALGNVAPTTVNHMYQVAVGYNAGANITTGTNNTAVGGLALDALTTGDNNIAIGRSALGAATTCDDNIAVGKSAMISATTSGNNVVVGNDALASVTTSGHNIAIGRQALYASTAANNTAVGYQALYANTTGTDNVAVGKNTLDANTTGYQNIALGNGALGAVTTGVNNVAIGLAGTAITTGQGNIAIGRNALISNVSSNYNLAIGYDCLRNNTSDTNTAVGHFSLDASTTGSNNTAVGYGAGGAVTTGIRNTFIGTSAGNQITTGNKNTILGRYTGNQGGLDIRTSNNHIVLSDGDGNPRVVVDDSGNTGIGTTSPFEKLTVGGADETSLTNQIAVRASDNDDIFRIRTNNSTEQVSIEASGDAGNGFITFGSGSGSAERMRITSGGNVGIGNANPQNKLDIEQSAAVSARLLATGATSSSLKLEVKGGATQLTTTEILANSSGAMTFATGTTSSTEAMRIDSSGQVGIGTSSPSAKLDIVSGTGYSDIAIEATGGFKARGDGRVDVGEPTGANSLLSVQRPSGSSITGLAYLNDVNNSTGLQISTSSGAVNLSVIGSSAKLNLGNTGVQTQQVVLDTSSGNVGIGTTSPEKRLHIFDSTQTNQTIRFGNPTATALADINYDSSGYEHLYISVKGTTTGYGNIVFSTGPTPSEAMRLDASGNLLVGKTNATTARTTTVGHLFVPDGRYYATASGSVSGIFSRTTSDGDIVSFYHDGTSVGSIGARNGDIYIGTGDTQIRFNDATDEIRPSTTDGSARDAGIHLGSSNYRFKSLFLSEDAYVRQVRGQNDADTKIEFPDNNVIKVYTAGSERARFDASGNLLVGDTSPLTFSGRLQVTGSGDCAGFNSTTTGTANAGMITFYRNGTSTGGISNTGTTTSYNTSSDQRLKDNIVDAPSASDDIDAIQVRSFDWKADGSHQKYGMVAQELNTVAPEAVTEGETEDDMMSVDYSKLVPMLVKEIQSLRARVAQLEGEN